MQGDLTAAYKEKDSKCVFLCVHDVGCNHRSIKVGVTTTRASIYTIRGDACFYDLFYRYNARVLP